jgi:cytochrome b
MKKSNEIIWSLPTRIIHWALASVVLLNAFVVEEGDPPHRYLGYAAVVFILVRFVIGFIGKEHERFLNFPISVQNIILFLKTHLKKTHRFPGHNPFASLIYIMIWICILSLGVSGWMMGLDQYFGEEWLEEIHEAISNRLLTLVLIHLVGMFSDSILYKINTWKGMFTGRRDTD